MDALSSILKEFEVSGSVFFCDTLEPPWELEFVDRNKSSFHCVRRGSCQISTVNDTKTLFSGDVAILLHGGAHINKSVGTGKDSSLQGDTLLMCGNFMFSQELEHPLFSHFPEILVLREEDISNNQWLKTTLDYMTAETHHKAPGSSFLVDRLTEALFVQFLRQYLITAGADNNFIAAVYDRKMADTLQFLYDEPARQWTVEELAGKVGMSRAAFSNRFTRLVGQSVYAYLRGIRMRLACRLLRDSDLNVSEIGEKSGYLSDAAFIRAFRKFTDKSPLSFRKQAIVRHDRSGDDQP